MTCTRFPSVAQKGTQGYTLVHPRPYWFVYKKAVENVIPFISREYYHRHRAKGQQHQAKGQQHRVKRPIMLQLLSIQLVPMLHLTTQFHLSLEEIYHCPQVLKSHKGIMEHLIAQGTILFNERL